MNGGERGIRRRPALGEQGDGEAAEYVAAAGGGQPRVAAGVDEPFTGGRGDDAAAALEDGRGAVAGGEFEGRGDPVRLHFSGAAAQ